MKYLTAKELGKIRTDKNSTSKSVNGVIIKMEQATQMIQDSEEVNYEPSYDELDETKLDDENRVTLWDSDKENSIDKTVETTVNDTIVLD